MPIKSRVEIAASVFLFAKVATEITATAPSPASLWDMRSAERELDKSTIKARKPFWIIGIGSVATGCVLKCVK